MKKLSLVCLVWSWTSVLGAQQPSAAATPRPTPPPGPWLTRAPEFAQWTITSKTSPGDAPTEGGQAKGQPAPALATSASGQKTPAPTDVTITIVKTKNIRYEQTVGATGTKIQKWCFPDMQLTVHGRGVPTVTLTNTATHGADYSDLSKADFAGFDWIAAKNYTGTNKVMDQDCLIFKDKVKLDPDAPGDIVRPAVACIGADSHLPVALQVGDEIRTYQFGPPPTDMLTPPPDISKALDKWRKALREAALPPTKP